MNILYDIDALKNMLSDICILTKTTISAYDYEGTHLANGIHHTLFCSNVHGRLGKDLCHECYNTILSKCHQSHKCEETICFMGLHEFCIPIIIDNIWAGHIVVAGIRTENSSKPDNPDPRVSWELYDKLPCFSPKQLESLKNILPKIIFDATITFRFDNRFEEITNYIKNNLNQKISVEHLCEKFHITKNTLYNIFDRNISITVNQYIANERIKLTKKLLRKGLTGESLLEKIGIENYSYLCRFFKKKTGMTITEYASLHGISLR